MYNSSLTISSKVLKTGHRELEQLLLKNWNKHVEKATI